VDQKHCTTRENLRTTPNITELQDMRGNGGNSENRLFGETVKNHRLLLDDAFLEHLGLPGRINPPPEYTFTVDARSCYTFSTKKDLNLHPLHCLTFA
jgi:hypothetical protein